MDKGSIQGTNSNRGQSILNIDFDRVINEVIAGNTSLTDAELEGIAKIQCPYLNEKIRLKGKSK